MNELIKITEHAGKKAVSARELHSFLESKKDFSDWIKYRINKYDLVENQDYVLLPNFGEQTGQGGHNKIEYALTLDCAKELAMVEGNAKGKQARRYFIACEEKLNEIRNNQLKQAQESAKQRLLMSNRKKEIDVTINHLLKERKGITKKLQEIDSFDFQQLCFSFNGDVFIPAYFSKNPLKIS